MTAQIVELFPSDSSADDTIRRTARGIMKGKGLSAADIAPAMGLAESSLYRKLAGKGEKDAFRAGEVAKLARILGVTVGQLYDGLGGTFVPPTPPDGVSSAAGTSNFSGSQVPPTSSYAGRFVLADAA